MPQPVPGSRPPTPVTWLWNRLCYNELTMKNGYHNESETTTGCTLRVLAIADIVEPQLYHEGVAEWMGKVDLIVSCGDLPPYYLDYLMTNLDAPLVHVLGNHCEARHNREKRCDPAAYPGAVNLHRHVINLQVEGCGTPLIVAGLEGSPWYNDGPHQYTEKQFSLGVSALASQLLWKKAAYGRYLDILVTHTPPSGIHDTDDHVHRGSPSIRALLDTFKPAVMFHGHTHRYDPSIPMRSLYRSTHVINAYGHIVVELVREAGKPGWQLKSKTPVES